MSVYFITAREVNRVKIGFTAGDCAKHRMTFLSVGSPCDLALEAIMPGTIEDERALHQAFAKQRVRGEWFTITPAIEELIERNRVEPEAPPARPEGPLSASDIISLLGNDKALSVALGLPITTVNGWKRANFIPEWRKPALLELAARKGVALSTADFPTADERVPRHKAAA